MKSPRLAVTLIAAFLLFGFESATAARLLTLLDDRPEAPPFVLKDTQGKEVSLADYKGKVLVINFWATWCPSCRKEMPSLNRGAAWLKKYDVELIAINVGEKPKRVMDYLQKEPVDFPILLDLDTEVSNRWDAMRLPITYVVDKEGRIVFRALGSREWDAPELLVPIRSLALPR
ncbi:MAG: TlpA family protein disulfide reductase [Sedimenticola sp.]|nr:TlpA family protein disulfide reductase [Sedimenticola sp.]